ncbi:MAG: glycosyltransferase [Pirellulaceae bacterium]|nr:glycosyltransferase [Pirellulaceae bacterium]
MKLVSHGFDPEVHRIISPTDRMKTQYGCDVSFVGCWSPKKESLIAAILRGCRDIDLRIWGPGWRRAEREVKECWQARGAYGDELCVIYRASKINLGLLSEAGGGTEVGDLVTVRTWQIPAAGGFMLHEDSAELHSHFSVEHEVATFNAAGDLPEQVERYLRSPEDRLRIAEAGHLRCAANGSTYEAAAQAICDHHDTR